jgi:hypothetical protein
MATIIYTFGVACREAVMREGLEAFGGELDVLVNNVGTNIRKPTVRSSSSAGTRRPPIAPDPFPSALQPSFLPATCCFASSIRQPSRCAVTKHLPVLSLALPKQTSFRCPELPPSSPPHVVRLSSPSPRGRGGERGLGHESEAGEDEERCSVASGGEEGCRRERRGVRVGKKKGGGLERWMG